MLGISRHASAPEGRDAVVRVLAPPVIQFAVRDGLHLAYQTVGSGPPDLVFVGGSVAMSLAWDDPGTAKGLRRLASFARSGHLRPAGHGPFGSYRPLLAAPTIDDLVVDLEAVIEAAGVTDPSSSAPHNGGAVAAVYATRHPVRQFVLCNTWARLEVADDFPIGFSDRVLDRPGGALPDRMGQGTISDQYASRPGGDEAGPARARLDQPQPARAIFPPQPHLRHPPPAPERLRARRS